MGDYVDHPPFGVWKRSGYSFGKKRSVRAFLPAVVEWLCPIKDAKMSVKVIVQFKALAANLYPVGEVYLLCRTSKTPADSRL